MSHIAIEFASRRTKDGGVSSSQALILPCFRLFLLLPFLEWSFLPSFALCSLACRWHSFTSRALIYRSLGEDFGPCFYSLCRELSIDVILSTLLHTLMCGGNSHFISWTEHLAISLSFCLARYFSTSRHNPCACQN